MLWLVQGTTATENAKQHDHDDDEQEQVNQVAAEWEDECSQQPEEQNDENDRFERVTHGSLGKSRIESRPKLGSWCLCESRAARFVTLNDSDKSFATLWIAGLRKSHSFLDFSPCVAVDSPLY